MAGIALVLDLLRKNPSFSSSTHQTLHSVGSFSAKVAISSVAASVAASYPFGYRPFLRSNNRIAYCDAGATLGEDHVSEDHDAHFSSEYNIAGYAIDPSSVKYVEKVYDIELKPLFYAFHWKTFGITTLRSFLMYYLPLLEPRTTFEDDDEDFLDDHSEERHVDLVTPFHKSMRQIVRESAVVTTRRVLERLAFSYLSQRMAWKLLKDAPKSAMRKAQRGMPSTVYFCAVARTTLRAHCLGVAASWVVQVGIDIYKTLSRLFNTKDELDEVDKREVLQLLGRRVFVATLSCTASLVFAAIGGGLGATLIRPSIGQWLVSAGCGAGDLAGPAVVSLCFDKLIHAEL